MIRQYHNKKYFEQLTGESLQKKKSMRETLEDRGHDDSEKNLRASRGSSLVKSKEIEYKKDGLVIFDLNSK